MLNAISLILGTINLAYFVIGIDSGEPTIHHWANLLIGSVLYAQLFLYDRINR